MIKQILSEHPDWIVDGSKPAKAKQASDDLKRLKSPNHPYL